MLNKSVYQGERFTAVFIGPGGVTFPTLLPRPEAPDLARAYTGDPNRYLVDAYAELVVGEREHPSLRAAAEAAGLYREDRLRSIVVTAASIRPYEASMRAIADSAAITYAADLGALEAMLRTTTAGRQGVPTGSMTMHLWRYVRRIVARALYDCGFFRDDVRESGTLTVFYENDVELIRKLLI